MSTTMDVVEVVWRCWATVAVEGEGSGDVDPTRGLVDCRLHGQRDGATWTAETGTWIVFRARVRALNGVADGSGERGMGG